jgi:hypothetical protein
LAVFIKRIFGGRFTTEVLTGEMTTKEYEKITSRSAVRLLVYTSTISAGHSITLEEHYDAVYAVVFRVTPEGKWLTPLVDEMIQMTARVRFPVTKRLCITTDTLHYCRDFKTCAGLSLGYAITDNLPLGLFQSGGRVLAEGLACFTPREYMRFVVRWLQEIAYPGSLIDETSALTREDLAIVTPLFQGASAQAYAQLRQDELVRSLPHPDLFFDLDGRRKCVTREQIIAANLPEDVFEFSPMGSADNCFVLADFRAK